MATVKSHGTDIYYEVHGEGEHTLLLAHGMGGNAAIWYQQIAAFHARYRIVTFDHRYFARSRCAVEDFRPEWFPDDALAIMDAVGVDRAALICQSMGGWTGSQLAIRHPERVSALVMSHTPGVFEHASAVHDARQVARLVSEAPSAYATPALAADYPQKNPAGAVLYAEISRFNNVDPAVIPRAIGAARLGVDTATLRNYKVPTLFITADKDVLFPAAYITALAATVPGAVCRNLGDAGHSSYFEVPEAFNAAVVAFLDALVGAV